MSAAEWTDTYGIHHWRILRSSYRKLAWVGFEPTTTEFRSDALTDWAIRPWVQLALRANFVQLLQFHLFVQCSHFISAIAFVSRHICFKRNLAQVITCSIVKCYFIAWNITYYFWNVTWQLLDDIKRMVWVNINIVRCVIWFFIGSVSSDAWIKCKILEINNL